MVPFSIIFVGEFCVTIYIVGSNKRNADNKVLRGLFLSNITENLNIGNMTIDGVGYTINTGSGISPEAKVGVYHSTLYGWTSIASFKMAEFIGVQFKKGSFFSSFEDPSWNACLRVGTTTYVERCHFDQGFYISLDTLPENGTLTFHNCYVNNVLLTAENVAEYLNEAEEGTLSRIIFN